MIIDNEDYHTVLWQFLSKFLVRTVSKRKNVNIVRMYSLAQLSKGTESSIAGKAVRKQMIILHPYTGSRKREQEVR